MFLEVLTHTVSRHFRMDPLRTGTRRTDMQMATQMGTHLMEHATKFPFDV
jgi:hypothetical protein